MITIISGTDRKGSRTIQVAQYYLEQINKTSTNNQLISLENMTSLKRDAYLLNLEKEILIPTDKFIIVMPEYNGSFPGILKLFFDITDIRKCWWYKKVLLVGVADGRGGNLRGIEQMTNILHYLKMNVHYNKLPLSKINDELNEQGEFINDLTIKSIQEQIESFIEY